MSSFIIGLYEGAVLMDINYKIIRKYGINAIEIKQILKGNTNTQFIVKTQKGDYFLRKYSKPEESRWNRIVRTNESTLFEHDVLLYASDHGIPCIPPIRNDEGNTITKAGEYFYALFPYIIVEDFLPPISEKGIRSAKLLAKYHEVMKNYPITEQRPNWGFAGKLPDWFHENELGLGKVDDILNWINNLRPQNETFNYLKQNAAYITNLVKMLKEEFPEDAYKKYPVLVNHGDYITNNIGINQAGLVLFDFDFCVRELRIYDLSILIAYTAGEAHTGKNIDIEIVRNIVKSYRKYSYMSSEELSLVPYMAIAYRLHIFLGNLGILKSTLNYPFNLIVRNLDGIRWLTEHSLEIKLSLESL